MDWLDFKVSKAAGQEKIGHQGTFNANPVSAAAGIATLEIIAHTDACARANAFGNEVRAKMNAVLQEERVKWAVHGSYSGIHIHTNPEGADIEPNAFDATGFIRTMIEKPRGDGITGQVANGTAGQWRRHEFGSVGLHLRDAWRGGDGGDGRRPAGDGAGIEARGNDLGCCEGRAGGAAAGRREWPIF